VSLRVLSVVGVCFASTAAFSHSLRKRRRSKQRPRRRRRELGLPLLPSLQPMARHRLTRTRPHRKPNRQPVKPRRSLKPKRLFPASMRRQTPTPPSSPPSLSIRTRVKKRVAQAKPRSTSAGALTAPTFEPSQDYALQRAHGRGEQRHLLHGERGRRRHQVRFVSIFLARLSAPGSVRRRAVRPSESATATPSRSIRR
jgi:hypothetical protein